MENDHVAGAGSTSRDVSRRDHGRKVAIPLAVLLAGVSIVLICFGAFVAFMASVCDGKTVRAGGVCVAYVNGHLDPAASHGQVEWVSPSP
jgi:hypothetical protein